MQLSLSHKILPKEQWTKMEEVSLGPFPLAFDAIPTPLLWYLLCPRLLTTRNQDTPYLSPILEQIKAEQKEKATLDTMEVLPKH